MLVGIDVAKGELVVAVRPSGERWTVANDEAGVRELVERVGALDPELVVCEATGLSQVGAVRVDRGEAGRDILILRNSEATDTKKRQKIYQLDSNLSFDGDLCFVRMNQAGRIERIVAMGGTELLVGNVMLVDANEMGFREAKREGDKMVTISREGDRSENP